jgi:SPP1 gp7 family putative phage head morphogenesis protein
MYEIQKEFRDLLTRLKYDHLDGLTKAELNRLLIRLRNSYNKPYSVFAKTVEQQLIAFVEASLKVNAVIYASTYVEEDEELPEEIQVKEDEDAFALVFATLPLSFAVSRLWSKLKNTPIPANGAMMLPFLKAFFASSALGLESTLRKGYANGWTPKQTVEELQKQMNKAAVQFAAVSATSMQHIAAMVSENIAAGLHGKYVWVSVIDSATTDICRSRNQRVYEYGKGPLPPAHINCRSNIVPYVAGADTKETFYSFIKRQSAKFQNLALGKRSADMLRSGKLTSKDVIKLSDPNPISIDEFSNAAKRIIRGE